MKQIPLRNRARQVVAVALVDDADFPALAQYRWHLTDWSYAARNVPRPEGGFRRQAMHREVLGLEPKDGRIVDHINQNPLDNRRENLRIVTSEQNGQNRRGHRNGSSRYRGVQWRRNRAKWIAVVNLAGRRHCLGSFDDELEAAQAASEFRARHMPYSADALKAGITR